MGQYFRIVCHDCRCYRWPKVLKLREIEINQDVAAQVGRFATEHPGHLLELRGDEWAKNPICSDEEFATYEESVEEQAADAGGKESQ